MNANMNDDSWMEKSIQEAFRDERRQTTIAVGAVIVRDNKEVASGHGILNTNKPKDYASNHAEYVTIKQARLAGKNLRGAVLYTTLEPCTYESRDPGTHSCFDEILDAGISKVVFGIEDPNPYVHGRQKL